MLSGLLISCESKDKIITEATEALNNRDYLKTIEIITSLKDKSIIESDTLSELLSTAYYGLTISPKKGIAVDCYDMDFLPDNKSVVFTDFNKGILYFYSYPSMVFEYSLELPDKAYSVDISPTGKYLAAALVNKTVALYDLKEQKFREPLRGHSQAVRDVVFKDDNLLFSCGNDRSVIAWDINKNEPIWKNRQNNKNIKSLQLSKDKTKLVTASNDGSACIINTEGDRLGIEELRVVHGDNYVNDAAISPDNNIIITVSGDGFVKIWDTNLEAVKKNIFLNEPLCSVSISNDGSFFMLGSNKNVYILDLPSGQLISKINAINMPIWAVEFVGNDRFAFADNSRFWQGKLLNRQQLLVEARKLVNN